MDQKSKQCPHCKQAIDSKAQKCQHCQSDLRSWPHRHPVIMACFILFVFFWLIGSATEKNKQATLPINTPEENSAQRESVVTKPTDSTPTKPVVAIPVSVSKAWHTAFVYSGDASAHTESFQMKGERWKVTYSCTNTSGFMPTALFQGYMKKTDGKNYEQFANAMCPKEDTAYFYNEKAGEYSLNLNTASTKYTVTVEDYY